MTHLRGRENLFGFSSAISFIVAAQTVASPFEVFSLSRSRSLASSALWPHRASKSIRENLSRTLSLSSAWRIATANLSETQARTPSWSCKITCSLILITPNYAAQSIMQPVPKNAICASIISRCGTWAGGSIPELPSWMVGGVSALGRMKRQVVPPFAGILTLSQTVM